MNRQVWRRILGAALLCFIGKVESSSSRVTVVTPAVWYYGRAEDIYVSVAGLMQQAQAELTIHDYQGKQLYTNNMLLGPDRTTNVSVVLSYDDVVKSSHLMSDHHIVNVAVASGSDRKEVVVRMSGDIAHVRLMLDKHIYSEGEKVHVSVFATDLDDVPVKTPVRIDIQSPSGIVVHHAAKTTNTEEKYTKKKNTMKKRNISGVVLYEFGLPAHPIHGTWTVRVHYGPTTARDETIFLHAVSSDFEVAEYDLPPFMCNIQDAPEYLIIGNSTHLKHTVRAEYTFGEPVEGSVVMHYGIGGVTHPFYMLNKNRPLRSGKSKFTLNLQDIYTAIKLIYGDNFQYEGKKLLLRADCRSDANRQRTVHDELSHIVWSRSPFIFSFHDAPTHFKADPDLPIVPFEVKYPNGKVAAKVTFTVSANGQKVDPVTTNAYGRAFIIYTPTNPMQPREVKFSIESAYMSTPVTYTMQREQREQLEPDLSITASPLQYKVGDRIYFDLHIKGRPLAGIKFYVISNGAVVKHEEYKNITVPRYRLKVSRNMGPRAHLVAIMPPSTLPHVLTFYVDHEACQGQVNAVPNYYTLDKVQSKGKLIMSGFPVASHVLLLMTDQAMQASPAPTDRKDTDVVAAGCSMDRHELSDEWSAIGIATHSPTQPMCQQQPRVRRDVTVTPVDCCAVGMAAAPTLRVSCSVHALRYLLKHDTSTAQCFNQFKECCKNATDSGDVSQSIGPEATYNINMAADNVGVRNRFPHSIMHGIQEIKDREQYFSFTLAHSMTTWAVHAVSLSSKHGVCVPPTAYFTVRRNIFVRLNLPSVAVRGETLLVEATVHNYDDEKIDVYLRLRIKEGICYKAAPNDYTEPVHRVVEKKKTITIHWSIVPLQVGSFEIQVVLMKDNEKHTAYDSIRTQLHVVREGTQQHSYQVLRVRPGDHSQQQCAVAADVTTCQLHLHLPSAYVPGSIVVRLQVVPNDFGPSVDVVLSGDKLHDEIGTSNDVLSSTAVATYAYIYQKLSGQLDADEENKNLNVLSKGVADIMSFMALDGGIRTFRTHGASSTWSSAFALKVFSAASDVVDVVDKKLFQRLVTYLYNVQETDSNSNKHGAFTELSSNVNNDARLTAYVLIALKEYQQHKQQLSAYKEQQLRAEWYLYNKLLDMDDVTRMPFMPLITYALTDTKHGNQTYHGMKRLLNQQPTGGEEFPTFVVGESAIQMVSYAILSALHYDDVLYSHTLVTYLHQLRSQGNGIYGNTQNTVLAMQALCRYKEATSRQPSKFTINVYNLHTSQLLAAFNSSDDINMKQLTANVVRSAAENNLTLGVDIRGHGELLILLEAKYNVKQEQHKCRGTLNVTVSPRVFEENAYTLNNMGGVVLEDDDDDNHDFLLFDDDDDEMMTEMPRDDDPNELHLNITVKHTGVSAVSMAVLEVGFPTGYKPYKQQLDKMVDGGDILSFVARDTHLTIYLNQMLAGDQRDISVSAVQFTRVDKLSSAAVSAYDYQEPGDKCVAVYSINGSQLLYQGDKCYEGICSKCYGGPHNNSWNLEELTRDVCTPAVTYVVRVRFVQETRFQDVVQYEVEVMRQYKTGLYNYEGFYVVLEKPATCGCPMFNTTTSGYSSYLIMGNNEIFRNKSYVLVLDEMTYVEASTRTSRNTHREFYKRVRDTRCTT